ncbi:putative leucine-rich repeat receptor-like serine/threonine-protein kinase At2g19230 isoform X1 [Musa acuminata AAA Group]|uniref:putative leucine-rich repeat receptor-like serine/threonine-protein kinase At2g19230 isoform X1 n=1 Tax=Musa acuminata AAA Group TaxID=214697 RepID=UPI0031D02958
MYAPWPSGEVRGRRSRPVSVLSRRAWRPRQRRACAVEQFRAVYCKCFISIDCGLAANTSYNNLTGIEYASDARYVDTGEIHTISSAYQTSSLALQNVHLRSFPDGSRNCYTLKPVQRGNKYLIRAGFLYGNYDGRNHIPRFDIYIGVNHWDSFKFSNPAFVYGTETMIVASADFISVCLVNTGDGTPFISSLELRPLTGLYSALNESNYFLNLQRYDLGSTSNRSTRYPYDVYDRMWTADKNLPPNSFVPMNTSLNISTSSDDDFKVSSTIMRTYVTPSDGSDINYYWELPMETPTVQQHIVLHFAEIELLLSNESRIFDIYLNGKLWRKAFSPRYLQTDHVFTTEPLDSVSNNINILKAANSTHPPILNALEVFKVRSLLELSTDNGDVDAIMGVKAAYQIKRNWIGDPCSPRIYSWEGLRCNSSGSMSQRLTYLNLADGGLLGEIAASFAKLGALEHLNLSGNSLSGAIPDALGELPFLRLLDLSNNQLQGSIPTLLQKRSENHSLTLRYEGNPDLCYGSNSCKQRKMSIAIIIVIVAIAAVFLLMVAACIWKVKRAKQAGCLKPQKEDGFSGHRKDKNKQFQLKNQEFTHEDIVYITKNFQHTIGKGGFGTVYLGELQDGTQVAVKVNSQSSSQGINEFQAEAELLTKIHHKNLMSLVGYCEDENFLALVYEYMAQGSLEQHLRGKTSFSRILQWIERLQIAIEAAQGLEYLHSGCKPPIIHRDVKPTNILLNHKGEAKIADFGVSRIFQNDQTHVSTAVVGTMGYLDPEYFFSCKLTEKSDVYSFGVVLLELITGLPAILRNPDRGILVHWVSPILARGDIDTVTDDRMQRENGTRSVWKAAEIALRCVLPTSIERPTMSEVVIQLKECMALEVSSRSSGRTQIQYASEVDIDNCDAIELSSAGTTVNHYEDRSSVEFSSSGMSTDHHQNEFVVSPSAALLGYISSDTSQSHGTEKEVEPKRCTFSVA